LELDSDPGAFGKSGVVLRVFIVWLNSFLLVAGREAA
jgi:hypothetical protein